MEKIKGTIASLVTVKDPSSNVFDEKLKQTIMEDSTQQVRKYFNQKKRKRHLSRVVL